MKSAAFGRFPSFFDDALAPPFFAEEVIGRLRRVSVRELESNDLGEGEAAEDELRDLGVIADDIDDFLDDDGVGVRSLLADAILCVSDLRFNGPLARFGLNFFT